jgi:hypothetical protein
VQGAIERLFAGAGRGTDSAGPRGAIRITDSTGKQPVGHDNPDRSNGKNHDSISENPA